MRVVELDGGFVLGERPLDLVGNASVDGDDVLALAETNDGEVAARELDAVFTVNEVEDGAGDLDEDIFGGGRRSGGAAVVGEEIFDEVAVVN